LRLTPHSARLYLLGAAFLIALPSLFGLYAGHSGKLLVASGKVPPGSFYQSVIYIAHHDLLSAYGYIINEPSRGGPVEPESVVVLARGTDGAVMFVSAQTEGARKLYGYAGWRPLQLNSEIIRGGWDVIDYDPALVFDLPAEEVWPEARRRVLEKLPPADEEIL